MSYSCFSRRKKTEMIYLLINESRKQSLTDKHLNHKNNHKSKKNQVFVLSLLCGNKKSETFGEKNRYKSGEFEVVFFSEAIMEPTQELGLPFGRGMLPIAACFLGIRICQLSTSILCLPQTYLQNLKLPD